MLRKKDIKSYSCASGWLEPNFTNVTQGAASSSGKGTTVAIVETLPLL
jgi:hypothetical protein